ncbi:SOS response-associated peptidase [Bacteroidota bacterium]
MCYNISYLTKKRLDYARRYGTESDIAEIEKDLERIGQKTGPVYYVSGYNHPDVPVITNHDPGRIQLFGWGLIPFWVKDAIQATQLSKRTLNARGEEMFEKPSFKHAAKSRRCLVIVDGFFEYHWKDGLSYPYFIKTKNGEPFSLAGLWSTWRSKTEDITRNTFSIVTTRANELMAYIHNQPKGSNESRMPVILPKEVENEWLINEEDKLSIDIIKDLVQPYDADELEAYSVKKLKGKEGVGNSVAAIKRFHYAELESDQGTLF